MWILHINTPVTVGHDAGWKKVAIYLWPQDKKGLLTKIRTPMGNKKNKRDHEQAELITRIIKKNNTKLTKGNRQQREQE